jgi:LmbE family N-acetylglucosaminyl deacetylase
MRRLFHWCVAATIINVSFLSAQVASPRQALKGPDERVKADILVVVAHPDDEGGVTPYLARAIYDEHKRVAVVFATRGGSGGNDYSREHGPALAAIREQEARTACAKLGITNVWFLDGKDTASQNVLNSLANWGHGGNLEALVRIVRLTRPELVISWLPGAFIGENHGDHQAAGVLATEAFDLAGDRAAFPAQVAGATKRLEIYLENLTPWQPAKLYFFSDADDQKQFAGTGPAYSVREISPSQKKPYWRLAMDAAIPHLTQFPQVLEMQKMNEEQLNKFFEDPNNLFWPEPLTLTFAKAASAEQEEGTSTPSSKPTKQGVESEESPRVGAPSEAHIELGGPWSFYRDFYVKHRLAKLASAKTAEIAIKSGTVLGIPLQFRTAPGAPPRPLQLSLEAPNGWKLKSGTEFTLPAGGSTSLRMEVATPELSKEELKKVGPQELVVRAASEGRPAGEVHLKVLLKASALEQ